MLNHVCFKQNCHTWRLFFNHVCPPQHWCSPMTSMRGQRPCSAGTSMIRQRILTSQKESGVRFFLLFFSLLSCFCLCLCVWGYSRYMQSMSNVWWQLRLCEHVARKEEGVVETDAFSGRFSTCKLKTARGTKTQGWRLAINSCSVYGCINYGAATNHKTCSYQGGLKPVTTSKNILLFAYIYWYKTLSKTLALKKFYCPCLFVSYHTITGFRHSFNLLVVPM